MRCLPKSLSMMVRQEVSPNDGYLPSSRVHSGLVLGTSRLAPEPIWVDPVFVLACFWVGPGSALGPPWVGSGSKKAQKQAENRRFQNRRGFSPPPKHATPAGSKEGREMSDEKRRVHSTQFSVPSGEREGCQQRTRNHAVLPLSPPTISLSSIPKRRVPDRVLTQS